MNRSDFLVISTSGAVLLRKKLSNQNVRYIGKIIFKEGILSEVAKCNILLVFIISQLKGIKTYYRFFLMLNVTRPASILTSAVATICRFVNNIWNFICLNCGRTFLANERSCAIIAVMYPTRAVKKLKPEKNRAWTGLQPITAAIPVQYSYQLSYQANWELVTCIEFVIYQ